MPNNHPPLGFRFPLIGIGFNLSFTISAKYEWRTFNGKLDFKNRPKKVTYFNKLNILREMLEQHFLFDNMNGKAANAPVCFFLLTN